MKNNLKGIKPALIVILITIVSILYYCQSGDDSVSSYHALAPPPPVDSVLCHRTDSFVAAQPHIGSLGMMVYDITAQKPVYSYNAVAPMRPASCMKLLSCVTALRTLGVNYQYRTRLYTAGQVVRDTLHGDIILKTHFDPAFNRDSLYTLLAALKDRGIRAVKGRVLPDWAFTQPTWHERHWTLGDLKVSRMGLLFKGYRKMRLETLYALHAVTDIRVRQDSIRFGRMDPRRSVLVAQVTTPLHSVVEKALKYSSNINAEALMYVLGYTVDKGGGFRHNGLVAMRRFVRDELQMLPELVTRIEDGCGLCPNDKMSAELLITLLRYVHSHPAIYEKVIACLPLSGTDGTLFDRMRGKNVQGRIRAKTGTLTRENGISTLAGYFTNRDGHLIAFAVLNNECPVMDGRWWQDRLCERAFLPKTGDTHSM